MDNRSSDNVTDAEFYWLFVNLFTLTKEYFRLQKDKSTITNVCVSVILIRENN